MDPIVIVIALGILVVLVLIFLIKAIHVIPQASAAVVERNGRYTRTLTAGLNFVVPFIDSIRARVDLREMVVTFPLVGYLQVSDVRAALQEAREKDVTAVRAAPPSLPKAHRLPGHQPMQESDPRRIGRYQLTARLGQGGMGTVYLGRSPGERMVAVKVIKAELTADPTFRQRFSREIEAARRVGGFHTAPVVAADAHGDPPWLVTQYIPGPSLHDVIGQHGDHPRPSRHRHPGVPRPGAVHRRTGHLRR